MARPAFSVVMEQVAQPFSLTQSSAEIATTAVAPTVVAHSVTLLPFLLFGLWLCGSFMLIFSWGYKWKNNSYV
jgi:ABC-type multidrug transport system permease subunit